MLLIVYLIDLLGYVGIVYLIDLLGYVGIVRLSV